MKTIIEKFEEYRREVIPEDAPPEQIVECRRAFFGGAAIALFLISEFGERIMRIQHGNWLRNV